MEAFSDHFEIKVIRENKAESSAQMNSKMDTQREKAFFENLKSHQVTSENEMKLIKFCMISTKLFSGDSS